MKQRIYNLLMVLWLGVCLSSSAAMLALEDAAAESMARRYFRAFEPRPLKLQPAGNHHRFEFITEDLFERSPYLQRNILTPAWVNAPRTEEMQRLLQRADAAIESGDPPSAARLYTQVLRTEEHNRAALFGLGISLTQMNRWGDAIRVFRNLYAISPDELLVQNNLAYMLLSKPQPTRKELRESIQLAQNSILANPLIPNLWDTLSNAYYKIGDYERALSAAQMSVRLGLGEDIAFGMSRLPAAAILRYQQQEEKCRIAYNTFLPQY